MSDLKNLFCVKIPMDWFTVKEGGKAKRIELKNVSGSDGIIFYTIKTQHPENLELSKNFDETIVDAIKAMKDKRNDKIIIKGVKVGFSTKQWMYPQSGCEIFVLSAGKQLLFKKKVSGENKKADKVDVQADKEDNVEDAQAGSPFRSSPDQAIEDGEPLEESMGKLPDGSGFMTATVKEFKSIVGKILKEAKL